MSNYDILAQRSHKVIYKDGDTVLKVFDSDFSKADILNEALNQARIEETGLPVPKLLEVSIIDGKWAIRTEFIPGKTLAQLMEEDPDKTDEYLALFVSIQKEIFSKETRLSARNVKLIEEIAERTEKIEQLVEELTEARRVANRIDDIHQRAIAYHDTVCPKMEAIRQETDKLELIVEDGLWTLPKYRELLFIR